MSTRSTNVVTHGLRDANDKFIFVKFKLFLVDNVDLFDFSLKFLLFFNWRRGGGGSTKI